MPVTRFRLRAFVLCSVLVLTALSMLAAPMLAAATSTRDADPEIWLRQLEAQGLSKPADLDRALDLLAHEPGDIAEIAGRIVVKLGDDRVAEVLLKRLDDAKLRRDAVAIADAGRFANLLKRLTRLDHGSDGDAWAEAIERQRAGDQAALVRLQTELATGTDPGRVLAALAPYQGRRPAAVAVLLLVLCQHADAAIASQAQRALARSGRFACLLKAAPDSHAGLSAVHAELRRLGFNPAPLAPAVVTEERSSLLALLFVAVPLLAIGGFILWVYRVLRANLAPASGARYQTTVRVKRHGAATGTRRFSRR